MEPMPRQPELRRRTHASEVLEDARRILFREPLLEHAPVLMISNVLPLEMCSELMNDWETDNGDSGFMRQIVGA